MSILIVEDNPVSAKILELYLHKNGYQTIVTSNGKQAVESLTSMPEIQLVISDIRMPEMNGLELFRKMKEIPNWDEIPFVICSCIADGETIKKAAEMGCGHYLIKPINEEQLLQEIHEAMEYERQVLQDKEEVISKLGLDSSSYDEVARAFAAVVGDKIAILEQQIERGTPIEISDLLDLSEGAALLGAVVVKSTLNKLATKSEQMESETKNSAYRLLLTELKALQQVLQNQLPKEGRTAGAELEPKTTVESYFSVDGDFHRLALPERVSDEIGGKVENFLQAKIKEMTDSGMHKFILDLSQVAEISLALIKLVIATIQNCRKSKIAIRVVSSSNLSDKIRGLQETRDIQTDRTIEEAKAAL